MEIKVTGHSHSARNTLHYIFYGSYDQSQRAYNEAKANANGIHKRNELVVGYNCHNGYKHALKDFDNYLKQKPKNKVQTLNVVLSFTQKDFNFRKPEDCYEASTIARNFMAKSFPNHQAIIALQQDNQRAIPHIHLIICALSMQPPYKTIPGGHSKVWYQKHPTKPYQSVNYGVEHLRHIGKECLNEYEGDFNKSLTGLTQRGQSTTTSLNHIQILIRNAVSSALSIATNKRTFRRALSSKYGVNASFKHHKSRRRRKRGRQSRRSRYKHDGVVFRYDEVRRNKSGNIMYRKNGKPRVRRHYLKSSTLARLTPKLSYKNIIKTLNINQKRFHNPSHIDIRREPEMSTSSSSVPLTGSKRSDIISGVHEEDKLQARFSKEIQYEDANYEASVSASQSENLSASASISASASYYAPLRSHDKVMSSTYNSISSNYYDRVVAIKNLHDPKPIHQKYMSNPAWKSIITDYHNYSNISTPNLTISQAMPKFSTDKVRKSAPFVYGPVLQTTVIAQNKGVKRFHIISNELNYTDTDVSLFHRVIDPLINGFRSGTQRVRNWAYINWRKGKRAIKSYFERHDWNKKLTGFKTLYKKEFQHDIDGIMNNNKWVNEPAGKRPIYKHTSHPFKLADLMARALRHRSHKSFIHVAYNHNVDDYNAATDKKRKIISSVDTLPKSVSNRFLGLVAPIMQTFNIKSAKASSASSASASASSASYSTLALNSVGLADQYSLVNADMSKARKSASKSAESWSSSYYWTHDPLASYANNASDYDSALVHINKLQESTKARLSGASSTEHWAKAISPYLKPGMLLRKRSMSSANISMSNARWTSSIADLNYFGWSIAKQNAISDNLKEYDKLISAGNHKHTKYTGSYGYVADRFKDSTVNFNQFDSLVKDDKSYSVSASRSRAIQRGRNGQDLE